MNLDARIELLGAESIDLLLDHEARVMAESGKDGVPVFHVFDEGTPWSRDREKLLEKWRMPLNRFDDPPRKAEDLGWTRTFGLWIDGEVRGAVSLWGNRSRSAFHRVTLSLGVERRYHAQGFGTALMNTARDWAKKEGFSTIDLFVFAENEPAVALYRKLGYREIGRGFDRWRIGGKKLGDITFALSL
jgi:ribosomal protein S18 acetylase RimI-like enzyme